MNNVLFPDQTPLLVLFNILLLVSIFFILQPALYRDRQLSHGRIVLAFSFILLFSLFSFWGTDWFHYQEEYYFFKTHPNAKSHLEFFYLFLIDVCPNYLIFRFIIWGGALMFFHCILRKIKITYGIVLLFFGVLFLPLFSYARVSLAITVMLYGMLLIYEPKENKKSSSYVLGASLLALSAFLHKSALLGILVIFFSFFFNPASSKNSRYYIIVLFLIIVISLRFMISHFMSLDFSDADGYAGMIVSKGQRTMSSEVASGFISKYVRTFLERGSYILCAIIGYKTLIDYHVPKCIEGVIKSFVLLVLLCLIFSVDLGVNTSLLGLRLFRFSLIPAAITLGYAFQFNLYPKLTKFSFYFCLVASFFQVSYSLYCSIVE